MQGDPATAEVLLDSGLDINIPDSEGYVALHKAVLGASPKVIELLLAFGADPNKESVKVTPPTVGLPKTVVTVVSILWLLFLIV